MKLARWLLVATSSAQVALAQSAPPPPPPSDAECVALPAFKQPFAFGPGEVLEYDIDALGANAGKMTMKVLPLKEGALPVEVAAQTNTFFSKVRRVRGTGTSYLSAKTLRPVRYIEESVENELSRYADVTFHAKDHLVKLEHRTNDVKGTSEFRYANEGLDVAGAIYAIRQMPMKKGQPLCFDAYGIRRLWRVFGKVEGREHVSLPVGEFEAWHVSGMAVRLDYPAMRREIHIWVTDDKRRLPLVAIGSIDLGVVRATLTAFSRPGDKRVKAEGKETLKW